MWRGAGSSFLQTAKFVSLNSTTKTTPFSLGLLSRPLSSSSLYDHRRIANRSGWKVPEDDDADLWELPNERLGNTYALNWSLNRQSITPHGDAFHNLFPRGLQQLSSSPLTKEKATTLSDFSANKTLKVFGDGFGNELSPSDFKQLFRQVRMHFSDVEKLFVTDGFLGSSAESRLSARFVTDNADTSLFHHHNVISAPKTSPFDWQSQLFVYVFDSLPSLPPSFQSVNGPFAAVDLEGGNVLIHSHGNFSSVQDLLSSVFAQMVSSLDSQFDLLNCDARISPNRETSLVFDGASKGNGFGSQAGELFGSKQIILSDNQISRVWKGVTSSSSLLSPSRGDVVVDGALATSILPQGNEGSLPSSIFILNEESSNGPLSRVSSSEASQLLSKMNVVRFGNGEKLNKLLSSVKDIFVVNGSVSEVELNQLFNNPVVVEVFFLFFLFPLFFLDSKILTPFFLFFSFFMIVSTNSKTKERGKEKEIFTQS